MLDGDPKTRERNEKIELTMDNVREKYGKDSIGFASVINNDLGLSFNGSEKKNRNDPDNL